MKQNENSATAGILEIVTFKEMLCDIRKVGVFKSLL